MSELAKIILRSSFFVIGITTIFFNPVCGSTFFTLSVNSHNIVNVFNNIFRSNQVRNEPVQRPIEKKQVEEIDEQIIERSDRIYQFSCKTDPYFYLAFVEYIFERGRKQGGISLQDEIMIITKERTRFEFIPKNGIFYFLHRDKKVYVKIDNHDKGIIDHLYSIWIEKNSLESIKTEIKFEIIKSLDNVLNSESSLKFIIFCVENGNWIPSFGTKKGEIPAKVNIKAQRFIIDYILKNRENVENGRFSKFFLIGDHGVGKTFTSREIAKKLKKKLYIINSNIKSGEELQNAIQKIPQGSVVDISDLGWFFYEVDTGQLEKKSNPLFGMDEIKNFCMNRNDLIIVFSANKTFKDFFNNFPGFMDSINLKIDFDTEPSGFISK